MKTLEHLKEQHIKLSEKVSRLEKLRDYERTSDTKIALLNAKKEKLAVKDKIVNLQDD